MEIRDAATRQIVCHEKVVKAPGIRHRDANMALKHGGNHLKPKHGTLKALHFALAAFLFLLALPLHAQPPSNSTNFLPADRIILPKSVPDPLEPLNRAVFKFNTVLLTDAVKPTAKVYRFVVAKPIRTGLGNIQKNVTYLDRLINNMLQGKWSGAGNETLRFLCNTTVGVAGFFDVASKWNIPKSDADFGQTFGKWGWQPDCFLMLPVLGPSNERDTLGTAADAGANPLFYISPYNGSLENPITFVGPYNYFYYTVTYNNLSDSVVEYVRFSQSEMDAYSEIQYAWTFDRSTRTPDLSVKGPLDQPSLDTLGSVLFTNKDPNFPDRGKTLTVVVPSTGKKLPFTYWLQPKKAPVVYIVPGLGSHRFSQNSVSLAEVVFDHGYSVVSVSSPFDSEFAQNASTVDVPAYLPIDGHDLHVALTAIDHRLEATYSGLLGRKALMGYSMGALESLYIASTEPTNQLPLIKFDRYIAIDTPVTLLHGVNALDNYYNAPLQWPSAERTDDIYNAFLKVAYLSQTNLNEHTAPPFDGIEAKFLIGFTFRLVLRDVIYNSQHRHNQGVLHHPISKFRRDPVYQEILQYSFHDYFQKFAIPYYHARGLGPDTTGLLEKGGDLRTYEAGLRANPDIRVIDNRNDFLLDDGDLAWLRATFPGNRLTLFDRGGHLGNLYNPAVQKVITDQLSDLK